MTEELKIQKDLQIECEEVNDKKEPQPDNASNLNKQIESQENMNEFEKKLACSTCHLFCNRGFAYNCLVCSVLRCKKCLKRDNIKVTGNNFICSNHSIEKTKRRFFYNLAKESLLTVFSTLTKIRKLPV